MDRRQYLGLLGAATAGVAGCSAPYGDDVAQYRRGRAVAYEHESLAIAASQERVAVGESITFELTNTGDSRVSVACHEPWALQHESETGWTDAVCQCEDVVSLCASFLGPGSTLSKTLTVEDGRITAEQHVTDPDGAESRERTNTVEYESTSGRYRFFLLGTSPLLAADFEIRAE